MLVLALCAAVTPDLTDSILGERLPCTVSSGGNEVCLSGCEELVFEKDGVLRFFLRYCCWLAESERGRLRGLGNAAWEGPGGEVAVGRCGGEAMLRVLYGENIQILDED